MVFNEISQIVTFAGTIIKAAGMGAGVKAITVSLITLLGQTLSLASKLLLYFLFGAAVMQVPEHGLVVVSEYAQLASLGVILYVVSDILINKSIGQMKELYMDQIKDEEL